MLVKAGVWYRAAMSGSEGGLSHQVRFCITESGVMYVVGEASVGMGSGRRRFVCVEQLRRDNIPKRDAVLKAMGADQIYLRGIRRV